MLIKKAHKGQKFSQFQEELSHFLPKFLNIYLPVNETFILVITLIFPEAKTHSRARALGLVGLLGLFNYINK